MRRAEKVRSGGLRKRKKAHLSKIRKSKKCGRTEKDLRWAEKEREGERGGLRKRSKRSREGTTNMSNTIRQKLNHNEP